MANGDWKAGWDAARGDEEPGPTNRERIVWRRTAEGELEFVALCRSGAREAEEFVARQEAAFGPVFVITASF